MRTLIVTIVAGLLLVYSGCSSSDATPPVESAKPAVDTIAVRAVELAPNEFVEFGDYYGRVKASKEATLVTFSGGTVKSIAVKEGAYVKQGQSLASIDGDKAQTLYETAKLNEKVTKHSFEQMKSHLDGGNASQLSVDQTNLGYLNARATRIDVEKNRRGALCIAPFNGVVVSRYIEEHQELAPGMPTFTIGQTSKMRVDVNISEGDIVGVEEGNRATVTFAALPGKEFKGKIVRLARGSSADTYAFKAQIQIDNSKGLVKPGLTARVKLALRSSKGQIVVPTEAILTEGDASYVMLAADGVSSKTPVVLGPSDSRNTVILSEAKQGDLLIVENNHIVVDGSPVNVVK